jgi:hypothetical protein
MEGAVLSGKRVAQSIIAREKNHSDYSRASLIAERAKGEVRVGA